MGVFCKNTFISDGAAQAAIPLTFGSSTSQVVVSDGTTRTFKISRNLAAAATGDGVCLIENANAGDDQVNVDFENAGTGANLYIRSTGTGADIRIVGRATGSIGAASEGSIAYDTTLHKLKVRGAAGWETITSV